MDTKRMVRNSMVWALLVGFVLSGSGCGDSEGDAAHEDHSLRGLLASDSESALHDLEKHFSITINTPSGSPRVETGEHDAFGNPIAIACSTCHTVREPNLKNSRTEDLNEFHQGLAFNHGNNGNGLVSCVSCHNTDDYDTLKLANGKSIEFTEVMTLCSQCHGPQYRDYQHGAHGGMNGYWDLNQGPRTRNNCIDCHDPHAPAYPHMVTTFKPIDRLLNASNHDEHGHSKTEHSSKAQSDDTHED